MAALETHWSLGVLVGVPIWALIILATLVFAVVCFVSWRRERDERDSYGDAGLFLGGWIGCLVALALWIGIIVSPMGYYPFRAEYHQWRTVEGTVQAVAQRQISDGKAMSQRYVVQINGQPYGVDDTRAALVKVGDHVRLSCIRDWEYASTPGYVCRWDQ